MAIVTWQTETTTDPMLRDLARRLKIAPGVCGRHLAALYVWAADALYANGHMIAHGSHEIAEAALWTGDPAEFLEALQASGWVVGEYWALRNFADTVVYREGGRLPLEEWRPIRKKVLERDGGRCHYCGAKYPFMHVDHIEPVSQGGTNELSNLVTACVSCNLRKGTKGYWEFIRSL